MTQIIVHKTYDFTGLTESQLLILQRALTNVPETPYTPKEQQNADLLLNLINPLLE